MKTGVTFKEKKPLSLKNRVLFMRAARFSDVAEGFALFNMALKSEAAVSEVENCVF